MKSSPRVIDTAARILIAADGARKGPMTELATRWDETAVPMDVPLRRIVVGIDFSEPSLNALAFARKLASIEDATIHLVHACRDPVAAVLDGEAEDTARHQHDDAEAQLTSLARQMAGHTEASTELGDAAGVILEKAEAVEADVIVVGTRGRSGLSRMLLGSTAERVLHYAPCPVLIVPPPHDGTVDATVD